MSIGIHTDTENEPNISSTSAVVGALIIVTVLLVVEIANASSNGPLSITHKVVLLLELLPTLVA